MDLSQKPEEITRVERSDDFGIYKTLLESTKAIPWKMNWQSQEFEYIGPQIEKLLGWRQDSWQTAQDWFARIHEDDRSQTAAHCIQQSELGLDHEADYRALKSDGSYVWIRDVVHVIRGADGQISHLIGFMFDISLRKRIEEELLAANKKLEILSCQDALTGVANRYLFNKTMDSEWARAMRHRSPLSLILFDIDHFKKYNDHYGHVQGDDCLAEVARAVDGIPKRSTDLFARYGGEEFAVILPDTKADAASYLAEQCRRAILALAHPHAASPTEGVLTISLGVASQIPEPGSDYHQLLRQADEHLYAAKKAGRNRVGVCPQPQLGD